MTRCRISACGAIVLAYLSVASGYAAPASLQLDPNAALGKGRQAIGRAIGNYTLVDHALARMERGLVGVLHVEGPTNPDIYHGEVMPGMSH